MTEVAQAIAAWQLKHQELLECLKGRGPLWEVALEPFAEAIASYARVDELLIAERGHPTAPEDFNFELYRGESPDEIIFNVELHGVRLGELAVPLRRDFSGKRTGWQYLPASPLTETPLPVDQTFDELEQFVTVAAQPHSEVQLEWLQAVADPQQIRRVQDETAELCLERLGQRVKIGVSDWIKMAEDQPKDADSQQSAHAIVSWQRKHEELMALIESDDAGWEDQRQAFAETIASYATVEELLTAERGYPTAIEDVSYGPGPGGTGHEGDVTFQLLVHGVLVGELGLTIKPRIEEGHSGWELLPVEPMSERPTHRLGELDPFVAVGAQPQGDVLLERLQATIDPHKIHQIQADAAKLCLNRLRERAQIGVSDWDRAG